MTSLTACHERKLINQGCQSQCIILACQRVGGFSCDPNQFSHNPVPCPTGETSSYQVYARASQEDGKEHLMKYFQWLPAILILLAALMPALVMAARINCNDTPTSNNANDYLTAALTLIAHKQYNGRTVTYHYQRVVRPALASVDPDC